MKFFATCLLLFFAAMQLNAQEKKEVYPGNISGVVRDSLLSYGIKSATVAVYRSNDQSLLSYQLTNNNGEFSFKGLPSATPLYLRVTFVGYTSIFKNFMIPKNTNQLDLKSLLLSASEVSLKEVVVTVPPISMKGDTLEFNAAAFKLDSNAVVEDLLRKIPNITLWADGSITVNGREVKSLLVEGKQFFGGDAKIATQNLPKNIIDKIQAYNIKGRSGNPADSVMELNVKLKKGQDKGYFGKLSGGYGTVKRYEGDGSLNYFNRKLQVSAVGATNNINKAASNINVLINNSSFKGVGANIQYQPNFESSDLTRSKTIGVSGVYDFDLKPSKDHIKKFGLDYFQQHKNVENFSDLVTTAVIGNQTLSSEASSSANNFVQKDQNIASRFEYLKDNQSVVFTQSFRSGLNNGGYNTSINVRDQQNEVTSFGNTERNSNSSDNLFKISGYYRNRLNKYPKLQNLGVFSLLYSADLSAMRDETINLSNFVSYIDPLSNRNFNRRYNTSINNSNQKLSAELKDAYSKWIGLSYSVRNDFVFKNKNETADVYDLKNSLYSKNTYLSNFVRTETFEEMPSITLAKSFNRYLTNRFTKSLMFISNFKQSIILQNVSSQKAFQNFRRLYNRFTPEVEISFNNSQFGLYDEKVSLKFNTILSIPTLERMAPLIDSTNFYYRPLANLTLKESVTRLFSIQYSHIKRGVRNPFDYNLNASLGFIENVITDSTAVSADNIRTITAVNSTGSAYANFSGEIRKSFKLKNSEIQLKLTNRLNFSRNPSYINNILLISENRSAAADLGINYNFVDKLAVEGKFSYYYYRSKQSVFGLDYNGENIATTLSSSYNLNKRINLSSNIYFKESKFDPDRSIRYCICNASATLRFFKGNNGEIKFSALDILRQNNNIVNLVNVNSVTFGTQSVLRQYFMLSLSYYPRKFGRKG